MLQQIGFPAVIAASLGAVVIGLSLEWMRLGRTANLAVLAAIAAGVALVLAEGRSSAGGPASGSTHQAALDAPIDYRLAATQLPAWSAQARGGRESVLSDPRARPAAEPAAAAKSTAAVPAPAPDDATMQRNREQEVAALRGQLAALQATQRRTRDELQAARDRLGGSEAARAELTRLLGSTAGELESQRTAHNQTRAALTALQAATPAPQRSAASTAAAPAVAAKLQNAPAAANAVNGGALRRKLDAGFSGGGFAVERIDNAELVRGQIGSYYRITLHDPADAKRFVFRKGAFDLADKGARLTGAIETLRKSLIGALPPAANARLYVEAFASESPFLKERTIDAGNARLESVAFLPRLADTGAFGNQQERQILGKVYQNAHLPVLRAAYVANLIGAGTGGAAAGPAVLQGDIKTVDDGASRSFDLVLFVAW